LVYSLYGASDTGFAEAKPYDPAENSTFLERLTNTTGYGEIFAAAERSQMLVGASSARSVAMAQGFDDIISRVRDATGVTLESPLGQPYSTDPDTRRRARMALTETRSLDEIVNERTAAFFAKARELKTANPDKLGDLDLDTDPAQRAAALAAGAERNFQRAMDADVNPVVGFVAAMGGAMLGSRKDPLFWASLPFGFAGAGRTAVERIASAALLNGTANAAFTAAAQPVVQGWRAEAGLDYGLSEAAKEVGFAFAVGGALGGGVRGLQEAWGRVRAGKGTKADYDAVERAGVNIDDEARAGFRAAALSDEADAAVLKTLPEGIDPERAGPVLMEGAARLDDPSAPPPLVDPPTPRGVTDGPALRTIDGAASYVEALDAVRADPKLTQSALASDVPQVRDLGRLASLPDEALDMVKRGELDPQAGAAIAATTPDPAEQAAMARLVADAKPQGADDARTIIAERIAEKKAITSAQAQMGAQEIDVAPVAQPQPPRRKAAVREASLLEYLAGMGLRDDPEVRALTGGKNPFLPGFGRLIRTRGGATLDDAFRNARDAGYLFDPNEQTGAGALTLGINDMLDKMDAELRGAKQWRLGVEPRKTAADTARDKALAKNWLDEVSIYRTEAGKELGDDFARTVDDELLLQAARFQQQGRTWDDAIERAIMEDYNRRADLEASLAREMAGGVDWLTGERIIAPSRTDNATDIPFDLPPFDIPARAPNPGDAAAAARNGGEVSPMGAAEPGRGGADAVARSDSGGAGQPARAQQPLAVEPGAEGLPQTLVPGVEPVTQRQQLQAAQNRPMRGGDRAPPAGGLFDSNARAQVDMFDQVPITRDDGTVAMVPREAIQTVSQRERRLAFVVDTCTL
jgi:hypothetical protein